MDNFASKRKYEYDSRGEKMTDESRNKNEKEISPEPSKTEVTTETTKNGELESYLTIGLTWYDNEQ